jgi:hypothetical protein
MKRQSYRRATALSSLVGAAVFAALTTINGASGQLSPVSVDLETIKGTGICKDTRTPDNPLCNDPDACTDYPGLGSYYTDFGGTPEYECVYNLATGYLNCSTSAPFTCWTKYTYYFSNSCGGDPNETEQGPTAHAIALATGTCPGS